MMQECSDYYDMEYASLIQKGATPLMAHTEALFWALDQIEACYGKRARDLCANTLRNVTLERRKTAGDL